MARVHNNSRWRKLSKLKRKRNPKCEQCAKKNIIRPAQCVDHIKPYFSHPELFLEYSNLQSLCRRCHKAKSESEEQERLKYMRKRQQGFRTDYWGNPTKHGEEYAKLKGKEKIDYLREHCYDSQKPIKAKSKFTQGRGESSRKVVR